MKRNYVIAAVLAVILIVIVAAAAAYYHDDDTDDRETIVVKTSDDHAPFNYGLDGELTGIDIDLLRAIGTEMDCNLKFECSDSFKGILDSVKDKGCDIAAAGITITDERAKTALFSDPYVEVRQVVVVKLDAVYTESDLKDIRVATKVNTTSMDIANRYNDSTLLYPNYDEAVRAVINGEADCEITDSMVAQSQLSRNPEIKVIDILDCHEKFAFMFPDDRQDLRDRVNAAMDALEKNGTVDDILDYYYQEDYNTVPSYFDQ